MFCAATLVLIGSIWINPCYVTSVRPHNTETCKVKMIDDRWIHFQGPKNSPCSKISEAIQQALRSTPR